MLKIFKKKEQKFYKIETDSVSGDAVFYMIARMLSTTQARHSYDSMKSTITFLSTKTNKEILNQIKKTFGDTYSIEDKSMFISMIPKTVKAL